MKKQSKKIILILLLLVTLLIVALLTGCVKKERWTWDEKGPGKNEWYEPGIPNDDEITGFEMLLVVMAIITVALLKTKKKK